mmetsp:Transcript_14177/g.59730  ORF Transcript_14177/g.59730 Transcript_14177/m.59730 type:complete len:221 (-) Transcript_14177:742-1404(-)
MVESREDVERTFVSTRRRPATRPAEPVCSSSRAGSARASQAAAPLCYAAETRTTWFRRVVPCRSGLSARKRELCAKGSDSARRARAEVRRAAACRAPYFSRARPPPTPAAPRTRPPRRNPTCLRREASCSPRTPRASPAAGARRKPRSRRKGPRWKPRARRALRFRRFFRFCRLRRRSAPAPAPASRRRRQSSPTASVPIWPADARGPPARVVRPGRRRR